MDAILFHLLNCVHRFLSFSVTEVDISKTSHPQNIVNCKTFESSLDSFLDLLHARNLVSCFEVRNGVSMFKLSFDGVWVYRIGTFIFLDDAFGFFEPEAKIRKIFCILDLRFCDSWTYDFISLSLRVEFRFLLVFALDGWRLRNIVAFNWWSVDAPAWYPLSHLLLIFS